MENSIAFIIVVVIAAAAVVVIAPVAGCCNDAGYTSEEAENYRSNAIYYEYKYNECDSELSKVKRHIEEDCKCK